MIRLWELNQCGLRVCLLPAHKNGLYNVHTDYAGRQTLLSCALHTRSYVILIRAVIRISFALYATLVVQYTRSVFFFYRYFVYIFNKIFWICCWVGVSRLVYTYTFEKTSKTCVFRHDILSRKIITMWIIIIYRFSRIFIIIYSPRIVSVTNNYCET